MKQLLLFFLFVLSHFASAQENLGFLIKAKVKQGSIMVGGNVGGSYYMVSDGISNPNERKETRNINAFMRSKTAYFVLHDLAVGLDVTLNHRSIKQRVDPEVENYPFRETLLLGGPYVRYYFSGGFFGDATVAAGLHNFARGNKNNLWEGIVGVGYSHFVNEKIALEPILSFRYLNENYNGNTRTTLGPVVGFGVQAFLLRRKAHVIKITL